jgi:ribosomal protein S18 acetylase RimI-like enzyme
MIREARPGDGPRLIELRLLLLESMLDRPLEKEELRFLEDYFVSWDGREPFTLVAEEDAVVGTISSSFYHQLPSPWNPTGICADLHNLSVDAACRRRGIARELVREILRECRRRRTGWVSLYATDMGIGLYRSLGFQEFKHPMPELRLYHADLMELEL